MRRELRSHGRDPTLRRLSLVLLVAIALAACAAPSRQFQTDLRLGEDRPYPVVLSDETGLVTRIEPGPIDPGLDYGKPAIRADPTDPNAFIVSWGGGPGKDAALVFKAFQDGYLLGLDAHSGSGFPGGTTGELVLRDVRIVTLTPIPLESIVAGGSSR